MFKIYIFKTRATYWMARNFDVIGLDLRIEQILKQVPKQLKRYIDNR